MSEIINISEDWQLHSGAEVQVYIKKLLGDLDRGLADKIGWLARVTKTVEGVEKECMLAFATRDDYEAWVANPESVTPILDFELPSGGGGGGTLERYIARLVVNPDGELPSVIVGGSLNVELRFTSLYYSGGQYINAGEGGTLIFQRSADGGETWQTVATTAIRSKESGYDTFDIAPYLVRDHQTIIRAKASFTARGSQVESIWVECAAVTYTALSVKNKTDFTRPLVVTEFNSFITQSFAVLGAVDKVLHVEIGGANAYNTNNPAWTYTSDPIPAATEYPDTNPLPLQVSQPNALTHGVHTVKAWLTCDDGTGHELSSEVVINRFMVVNAGTQGVDLYAPKLILQDVVSPITNYVHTVIARYAVWVPSPDDPTVPSTDPLALTIRLTNSGQTIEYMNSGPSVMPGIEYNIETTVEIESDQQTEYAFLYIMRGDANFLQGSLGVQRIGIQVDNSENYAPEIGADFVLNPKNRNNSESNPRTIVNSQTGRVVEGSTFENFNGITDLWVTTSDNQKVLRVLAGSKLTIAYEPFRDFINDGGASMTLDIDFAVRNITQEDEPMLDVCQIVGGELLGLRMLPLEGYIKCASHQSDANQNFAWQEGVRTHLSIVLNPSVVAKADDELTWQRIMPNKVSRPLALAKVYINGVAYREVVYANNQAETAEGRQPAAGTWCRGGGHGGIKIGNPHADIDIYGIRCYRSALSSEKVIRNHIASLPTAAEKRAVKSRNAITANGRISYALAKEKGYRCLTLVGQDQYKLNQNKEDGYPCYWRIDHDQAELSGTIGKAAYLAKLNDTLANDEKCLVVTPQGSTANTYWDNNEQTKIDGINYRVNIPFSKVHSDFGWEPSMSDGEDCECPMYLNGSRIEGSSYGSLDDSQKSLVRIEVQDGWFDGSGWSEFDDEMGMYHGQFYTSYVGGAKCTKVVNKINYASSMQSHKMAATRFYHDVMKQMCGSGKPSMSKSRYSVYEESFLFFTEHPDDNGKVEFRGMCTFGDGKFDKAVFGYKADKRTFAFEGLNNDLPLCDFRVPADEKVTYDPDEESWSYGGTKSFEYGLGNTEKRSDGKKYPLAANDAIFRKYVNFIYCHNTSLRYYEGTKNQFDVLWNRLVQSTTDADVALRDDMMNHPYWCTGDLRLYRYDFVDQAWVDAGVWDEGSPTFYSAGVRNLAADVMTSGAYDEWLNDPSNIGEYDKLNEMFRAAIARHGREHFGLVADVENHKTHYNVVNFMLAGTDNCSKNMYYQYDPATGLIYLDGDDLDSILKTDNNGNQTKVYFLDRIHDVQDYLDGYKQQIDYGGRASALFNFIEAAYEETNNALRENMRSVLSAMVTLCGGNDASAYGCIEKYFFSVQSYFPEVAYNEQARLRYEWPKSFDYISYGNQARGIDPITQQVGSQLESERQYMKRRLALIASYAAWGDFAAQQGNVGLGDAGQTLSMMPGYGRSTSAYLFDKVIPHQWLYPLAAIDRNVIDPHVRVAPGEGYIFNVKSAAAFSNDSSVSLCASNYYREFGNMGNMVIGNEVLAVPANRLTAFVAEPAQGSTAFQPGRIALSTPNLRRLSLNGCSAIGGTMDFSALTRLESLDLRGTSLTGVTLPASDKLVSLSLPMSLIDLVIDGQPNVGNEEAGGSFTIDIDEVCRLKNLTIKGNDYIESYAIVRAAKDAGAELSSVVLHGIAWGSADQGVDAAVIDWLTTIPSCELAGEIYISDSTPVTFDMRSRMLAKWGDAIANETLKIHYKKVTLGTILVDGESYISQAGDYQFSVVPQNANANDFDSLEWSVAWKGTPAAELSAVVSNLDEFRRTGLLRVADAIPFDSPTNVLVVRATVGSTVTDPWEVGLYYREAEVGDLVYADGSWSDKYNPAKTVVGVCFYVNGSERRMVALTNLYTHGIGDVSYVRTYRYCPIGLDRALFTGAIYDNPLIANGVSNIEDVAQVGNVTIEGMPPYNGMYGYTGNDTLPVGMVKTLKWIFLRDYNLAKIRESSQGFDWPYPSAGVVVDGVAKATELDSVWALRDKAGSVGGLDYKMVYYVAPSVCFAYVPSGVSADDERFGAHHWWLPTSAELLALRECVNNEVFQPAIDAGLFTQLSHNNLTGSNRYYYWSCDEYDQDDSYSVCFSEATGAFGQTKNYNQCVRAVCKF